MLKRYLSLGVALLIIVNLFGCNSNNDLMKEENNIYSIEEISDGAAGKPLDVKLFKDIPKSNALSTAFKYSDSIKVIKVIDLDTDDELVYLGYSNKIVDVNLGGKRCYYDLKGNNIEQWNNKIVYPVNDDLAIIGDYEDGVRICGIIDKNGNYILEPNMTILLICMSRVIL